MNKLTRTTRSGGKRTGAALAEVLIAVIAMGIGVMSLAALFPVAVMRSVQGHQLTQGTILRFSAESKIDTLKIMYVRPDQTQVAPGPIGAGNFLFDPLGKAVGLASPLGAVPRFDGGFATDEATAGALVAADDNWIERYSDVAASYALGGPFTATLPNFAAQGITAAPGTRAVIYDVTGTLSQVRPISNISGDTITWTDPLPPTMTTVGKVRVETQERQFTWMLTCRRTGTAPNFSTDIDVTVFFRRSFDRDAGTNAEPVINNAGGQVFVAGSNVANVSFTGGNTPTLRRGGFVFDATNARWYRMESIVDNGTSAVITLDRPAVNTGTAAVFFGGIVDVYSLETKHD